MLHRHIVALRRGTSTMRALRRTGRLAHSRTQFRTQSHTSPHHTDAANSVIRLAIPVHTKRVETRRDVRKDDATNERELYETKRLLSLTTRQTRSRLANRPVRSRSSDRYVSPSKRRYSSTGKIPFRFLYRSTTHAIVFTMRQSRRYYQPSLASSTGSVFIAVSGR